MNLYTDNENKANKFCVRKPVKFPMTGATGESYCTWYGNSLIAAGVPPTILFPCC